MLTDKPVIQSIAEQTVLLKVSFGMIGNSRKVPTSIIKGAEGKKKLLKIHKAIFESEELTAIQNADMQMRAYLDKVAMPFDAPLRLVPLGKDCEYLQKVHDNIRNYAEVRAGLVDVFISVYPVLVSEYRERMEELALETGIPFDLLWSTADCPSVEEARKEFTFRFGYHSVSAPDSLKLAAIYDEAKENAAAQVNSAAEQITILMRQLFLDLVTKLKDALEPAEDGKRKKLHASSIKKMQEFIAEFKDRNITNDTQLEALVNDVATLVDPSFSVEQLKKDEGFKTQFHDQLAGFADKLTSLVETIPGRKFKDI